MFTPTTNEPCDCGFNLKAELRETERITGPFLSGTTRRTAEIDLLTMTVTGDVHTFDHLFLLHTMILERQSRNVIATR